MKRYKCKNDTEDIAFIHGELNTLLLHCSFSVFYVREFS